jgi:class 3 adenylate cyclase
VNLLFRLEKIASAAKVRCSATAAALQHWPEPKPAHTSLGRHVLKGFDGEHELFALT